MALAEPGKVYVIYLPHGGRTTVDLSAAQGLLTAQWFNPRVGEFGEPMRTAPANLRQDFSAPETNDWALLIKLIAPP